MCARFTDSCHIKKIDLIPNIIHADFPSYDILIVNSTPLSGQFNIPEYTANMLISELSSRYKIITTKKLSDIPCTSDYNMSLYQIGQLSMCCRCIIAVSTGPSWPALNIFNLNTGKPILLLCDNENIYFSRSTFNTSNIHHIIPFVASALD